MNRKQRRASAKTAAPVAPPAADPMDLHALGVEAFRAGDNVRAVELIARATALNGQVPSFHYNLAIALKALGRLQDAAASYQRALDLKPDYAEAHNNLGNVWKALGQRDKARASFAQALAVRPGYAEAHYNLGVLAAEASEPDVAARHLEACLDQDPGDSRGVRMLLARLGAGVAPQQTPPAHLLSLYDVRSRFWDGERYFGADLVAGGLRRHAGRDGLDILDIGCGTGLVGAALRDLAGRLDGVDLSPAMLEKAKAKGVYDELFQGDLVSFLAGCVDRYDAVVGAATLIHFGDLEALFQAVFRSLRAQGLFVFTVFPHEDAASDYAVAANHALACSGCFGHSAAYVERLARETGFSVAQMETAVHEHDQDGNPVAGMLAVLQRA